MKTKLLIVLSIISVCFSNCKDDDNFNPINCTTVYIYGLNITLKDVSNNSIITNNINIIATDGVYQETLTRIENSDYFIGAGERAGTYILTITSPDYDTYTSESIIVSADDCHVITEVIELTL